MSSFQQLLEQDPNGWLSALPGYQQQLATTLLSQGDSPEQAAEKWLSAAPKDTYPFGGLRTSKLYLEKLLDELEAFLCGDPRYNSERAKLAAESKATHALVVSSIAVFIAPAIGTSAPIIAPVIALLMITSGRLGLNAWCALRRDARAQRPTPAVVGTQEVGTSQ